MVKVIVGVDYQLPLLRAYVKIAGQTLEATERKAKQVAARLRELLPEVTITNPRYEGFSDEHGRLIFEIPVILGVQSDHAKAVLAKMLLKGDIC